MADMQQDIQHFAVKIGSRPPLSAEADAAAQYVVDRLGDMDIETWRETFFSPSSTWQQLQPQLALALTSLAISTRPRAWLRQLGVPLAVLAAWGGRQVMDGQAAWWDMVVPQERADNVLARIPASETMRQRVVLVAHVDSEKIRFSSQPIIRQWLPNPNRALQQLVLWSATIPTNSAWIPLRHGMRAAVIGLSALLALDEQSDLGDGANDNASGVAVLLALAEQLKANPLPHTEVIFAFTNSDTVNGRGTAEIATQHLDEWKDAYWIVLDSVGAGELCWIQDDSSNQPEYTILRHVMAAASQHRTEGIMGRSLAVPNPARPLLTHHLNAVGIMGYDRADNVPVGWRTAEDAPSVIDDVALDKAQRFVTSILQSIETASI